MVNRIELVSVINIESLFYLFVYYNNTYNFVQLY